MKEKQITLTREILFTDWYKEPNKFAVMLHLIFLSKFAPEYKRRGIIFCEAAISLGDLAKETGLSVKQVRTAIDGLIYMGELEKKVNSERTVYTILNYGDYVNEGTGDE